MSENKNIAWFRNAKYGLFIHFGIYSVLEGSYHGERSGNYAEWIWSKLKVPNREVERIAKTAFQPMYFDAEEWVRFAKECGMEYIILTAKHHEGFALYHSKADPYNVVDFTPFGRDILAELAAACRKYQLRLGIYYSQDLDWHEEHGGGYTWNHIPCEGVSFSNTWDFGWDSSDKNYDICFRKKILPQVKELMTGYGDISLV